MRRLLLLVVVVYSMAANAQAQSTAAPAGDVGVGYSFIRILEEDGTNMPTGWLLSVSGRVTPVLSIVGEIGGNYKSESGMSLKLHTFQGGLRASSRANPTFHPYVQFLVGGMNLTCCGNGVTKWVVEPGGGVDVSLNDSTALRFGAGIPIVFFNGDTSNLLRLHAGVRFEFGSR